jgi:hypothetical protein
MLINRNQTNETLMNVEEVRTALDAGNVVLIDKVATTNPEYTNLYFLGYCEVASSSEVSEVQRQLLGWDSSIFPMRVQQNAKTEIADKFTIGQAFDKFAIQIVDSLTPAFADQKPRLSKSGDVVTDINDNPIYRNTRLVTHDELAEHGHKIIERKRVNAAQAQASVKAAALMESM